MGVFGSVSLLDEWIVLSPENVPKRLSDMTMAQRWAAQNGQYSAPMYSTSGLPPEVSGLPLTVAKYPAFAALAAGISLAGMKSALLTVPAPTWS